MRKIIDINKKWKFIEKEISFIEAIKEKGRLVNLPHTWNAFDGQDGGADYKRASYFYRYDFKRPVISKNEEVYLEFNAISQIATIYFNNNELVTHEGGFSRFRVNITSYLKDNNTLLINVSNKENDHVYPQQADFTFFGGIYRDVFMIIVNKCHFDLDYYGSNGIKITPTIKDNKANILVNTYISNRNDDYQICFNLYDNNHILLDSVTNKIDDNYVEFVLDNYVLWDGFKNPYLYNMEVLIKKDDEIIDNISSTFGIRKYKVDSELGFILNDKVYPLRGVCRHQDRLNKGWAIGKKEHEEDIKLIKEVGANTIRLAHYQQDEYIYDLCDKEGFCIWAEIPFITRLLENGMDNTISQMKELVIQNYNHPSIIVWGLSNETSSFKVNDELLIQNHDKLNKLVHELDNTRLTTIANISFTPLDSKLNTIPDLRSYNIYCGWYGGSFEDNEKFVDNFHKLYPHIAIGISEYGAEANIKLHSSNPKRGDYSEEYQALYHEHMANVISQRKYLWATHIWNMFDFAADARNEGNTKGRNNKGLVTYDRKIKKDSFYLYKAYWSNIPFIHITSKRFRYRTNTNQEIKIYSNLEEVSLYVNNKFIETKKDKHIFVFNVKLKHKINFIKVISNNIIDKSLLIILKKEHKAYSLTSIKKVKNWFK